MTTFRDIFLNRHAELRIPWRVLLFLILGSLVVLALNFPLHLLALDSALLSGALSLLGLLLATFVMTRFINRKPFGAVGLMLRPDTLRQLGMGLLLGFLMMGGIFMVELGLGYATPAWRGLGFWDGARLIGSSAALFAISAAIEELIFRGYLFQTVIQATTFLPAAILFSGLFASAHVGNPFLTTFAFVNTFLAGLWLSFAYLKSRSLWLPFALHFGWNFSQTTLFGFPTSGRGDQERMVIDLLQSGPQWITGGSFGPEGGVLCTIALLISTGYVLKSRLFEVPSGAITLDSLEDLVHPGPGSQEAEK